MPAARFGPKPEFSFGRPLIQDGATPATDIRIVKDGFVCLGMVEVGEGKARKGVRARTGRSPALFGVRPTGVHVTRALRDGETIEVGSKQVRVLAVPGHTAGSAAYLVSGVLFLGDSAGMKTNGKLSGAPWAFSDSRAQNHASLRALADRLRPEQTSIVAIVPAHTGIATFDPLGQFQP